MESLRNIFIAIVVGLALVGVALYATGGLRVEMPTDKPERIGKHRALYGNESAPVTIVEFSDFECPFCARLHPVLKQLVDESDGQINWEYRHFPLGSHKNAEFAAVVGECVLRENGREAFWEYSEAAFAAQRTLSESVLIELGMEAGLDANTIEACRTDSSVMTQIEADKTTAVTLGGSGTPFSIIVREDGSRTPVRGALPIENWRSLLNL